MQRLFLLALACSGLVLTAVGLSAAETEERPAPASAGAGATAPEAPRMLAHGSFFDAGIEVDADVELAGGAGFGRGDGGRSGRAGGANRGGRGRRGGADEGVGMAGGYGTPRGDAAGREGPATPRPTVRASNAPLKRLHLRLTNRGASAVTVEVVDFKSAFGNFAVRPSRLTVPAGKSVEVDPMLSRLEVEGDAFPLTVTLQVGDKTEEQTLMLRWPDDAGAAPAAASASAVPRQ